MADLGHERPWLEKPPFGYGELEPDNNTVSRHLFNEYAGAEAFNLANSNFNITLTSATWSGIGLFFDGTHSESVGTVNDFNFGAGDSFTVHARIVLSGVQPDAYLGDTIAYIAGKGAIGADEGFSLALLNETPVFQIRDASSNLVELNYAVDINDGKEHTVKGVLDRVAQMLYLYVDGVLRDFASSAAVGSLSNTGEVFKLSGNANDLWPFYGHYKDLGVENGLDAGRNRYLYPYADLIAQQQYIPIPSGAAPTGFKPHWAVNRTQIIGSGLS
jgi:hypothetical protein